MGIQHQSIPGHWNYFLVLEADVQAVSRWIEFSESNNSTYSIELARLLMTAAAEVDVVAKLLCANIGDKKADNIKRYRKVLKAAVPDLMHAVVEMPAHGLTFTPWSNWDSKDENKHPDWWTANNKVKHHRGEHFDRATLKNVLNATAGLLLLLVLYYGKTTTHLFPPKNFQPRTFAMLEGQLGPASILRLLVPEGVPWEMAAQ